MSAPSKELKDFCGFIKLSDAAIFTCFRERLGDELSNMFERLVEMTEPICREIDTRKAAYLIYDNAGIKLPFSENNSKLFNSKLKEAKMFAKSHPGYNPYNAAYKLIPPHP